MKKGMLFIGLLITVAVQAQKEKAEAYINAYKELAIEEMMRTGVPASIKLAQGILESQAGESNLAKGSNNHFGIKCKTEWTGIKTYQDDDERGECFRVYTNAEESFKDHSDFLKNRPNYAFLFKLDPTDYEGWATGLKKAGYATSPSYPQRLLKVINDYNLQQYSLQAMARLQNMPPVQTTTPVTDTTTIQPIIAPRQSGTIKTGWNFYYVEQAKSTNDPDAMKEETATTTTAATITPSIDKPKKNNPYPSGIFTINQTKVMYATEGTSLLSIANQFDIALSKLIAFNELAEMDVLDMDRLLFIERKPKRGSVDVHVVAEGESIHDISQREGIRLENLLEFNRLAKNASLKPGDKIQLRPISASGAASPRLPK